MVVEKAAIKEFRVERINPSQKFMDVSLSYISAKDGKIIKRFNFFNAPIAFTDSLLDEVKNAAGAVEIEKRDEMKDKIANIMIRLIQEINDLAKIKEHEKFMKAYNRINCYKVSFPEVVV